VDPRAIADRLEELVQQLLRDAGEALALHACFIPPSGAVFECFSRVVLLFGEIRGGDTFCAIFLIGLGEPSWHSAFKK
jgi:hypothetical protein